MLEIACFEITSAEIALNSCADRIEFCKELELGGTTPDIEEFIYLKEHYQKPIFVMIRPRGGNFFYSDAEFEQMKKDIIVFKNEGADGFVFGILNSQKEIDIERNKQLVELAGNIPCTFHRAFDRTPDIFGSLNTLIKIGFKTVLTSGGEKSALEGAENLHQLIQQSNGEIDILIGGGVRSNNLKNIKEKTKGTSFHSSAILKYELFANPDEIIKLKEYSAIP
ncbi:MAG: copper homeostasis protein [Flavobacteriales bacterium]|nr:MAG: copper homeostasis protein [Flavobacteriales bacterium]